MPEEKGGEQSLTFRHIVGKEGGGESKDKGVSFLLVFFVLFIGYAYLSRRLQGAIAGFVKPPAVPNWFNTGDTSGTSGTTPAAAPVGTSTGGFTPPFNPAPGSDTVNISIPLPNGIVMQMSCYRVNCYQCIYQNLLNATHNAAWSALQAQRYAALTCGFLGSL